MVSMNELVEQIKELDSEMSMTLNLTNGDSMEVGAADCWIGGEGCDGWMCDYLGNTVYSDANSLAEEIFDNLDGAEIESID